MPDSALLRAQSLVGGASGGRSAAAPFAVALSARAEDALRLLGGLAPAALGAMQARLDDFTNHARRSVFAHHGLPDYRGGQKFIGATLRGYVAPRVKTATPGRPFSQTAEVFEFSRTPRIVSNLEEGASITARDVMVVPLPGVNVSALRRAVAARALTLISRPRRPALLVVPAGRTLRSATVPFREGSRIRLKGAVMTPVAVLLRRRRQPPRLRFLTNVERIIPRHLAKIDRTFDVLLGRLDAETAAAANAAPGQRRRGTFAYEARRGLADLGALDYAGLIDLGKRAAAAQSERGGGRVPGKRRGAANGGGGSGGGAA